MNLLGRHEPRFSARNSYADALLGMVRACDWLEGLICRENKPAAAPLSVAPEDARAREEMTYFVLGLVSTSRAARRLITLWATRAPPAPPGRFRAEDARLEGGLLR
jgi:hypothetical protein